MDDGVNGVDWWSVWPRQARDSGGYSFERMVIEAMWMLTLPYNK